MEVSLNIQENNDQSGKCTKRTLIYNMFETNREELQFIHDNRYLTL